MVVITRFVSGNSDMEKRTQMPLMKSHSSIKKYLPVFPFINSVFVSFAALCLFVQYSVS